MAGYLLDVALWSQNLKIVELRINLLFSKVFDVDYIGQSIQEWTT